MRVGVPTEVKDSEFRVAITPAGVRELTVAGHEVLVQAGAGEGSSLSDDDYTVAGARIVPDAATAWGEVDMVLKVKEPIASEFDHLRADLVLFTYLHLAAARPLTEALLASGCTGVAYETVVGDDGGLPLLAPMSEVAGRMAPQVGAHELERP
jgi:alanine dehydrogenase